MFRTITSKGIIAGSLYKILFIGHAFSLGLFILVMGVFSLFGYETVKVGGVHVTGINGLLAAVVAAGGLCPAVFILQLDSRLDRQLDLHAIPQLRNRHNRG